MFFLVQLLAYWHIVLQKNDFILDVFCKICEVLQDFIFTENRWATASDFK